MRQWHAGLAMFLVGAIGVGALSLLTMQAYPATTLLPNGEQCFQTATGPVSSGSINMYYPGTTNPKTTWTDSLQASPNTQPIQLDANGCAIIYGVGSYRQQLYDGPVVGGLTTGNQIFDLTTTDTSAYNAVFWAGLAGGTPNALTVVDAGFNATDGTVINFSAIATNTSSVTLNPSVYGAIPVVKDTTSGPVSLTGGEIVISNIISVVYRASDGQFHILNPVTQSSAGSGAPLCGATRYNVTNTVGSPNTQLTVTAESAVMVSGTGGVINRSNVSVNINTAVVGANGIDTGVLTASTILYVYLIDNGSAPAGLVSTLSVGPTLPAGYTFFCRLSADFVDASTHLGQIVTQGFRTQIAPGTAVPATLQSTSITGTCFNSFTATTFNFIPGRAIRAVGTIKVVGAQKAGLSSDTLGTNIHIGASGVAGLTEYMAYVVPLTTPKVLNYCSDANANVLSVSGWDDHTNAN